MQRKSRLSLRSLLAAAVMLTAATPAARAYDLGDWSTESDRYYGGESNFSGSRNLYFSLGLTQTRAAAGAFQIDYAESEWFGNDVTVYDPVFGLIPIGLDPAYTYQAIVAGGVTINSIGGFSQNGTHIFVDESVLMPTSSTSLNYTYRFDQNDGVASFSVTFGFSERALQIAYTRAGSSGDTAIGAFASDNTLALAPASYTGIYNGLNVLERARTAGGASLAGSYVRGSGLTVSAGEGLYAKDGGWLDIRGNLDVSGGLMIRDAEITSNIFSGAGNLGSQFESGILSVRGTFAQHMYVQGSQTIGLRDGAVNEANIYIQGSGYSNPDSYGMFGSIRSITGINTQNGQIIIGWVGGAGNFGTVSADQGSTFVIKGSVNGAVGLGGSDLTYNVGGQVIQEGIIGGFIDDVTKASGGDLRLTASNTFTGDILVNAGTVTAAHSHALAAGSATYVSWGASLVLDGTDGNLGISEDVSIAGAGATGAALYNYAGANTLTGQVTLTANSSIATAASSSLIIDGDLETQGGILRTLDITTEGAGLAASTLSVTGHSGDISGINKFGAGTATIATADADLLTANVVAGKLVLSDSSSTSGSPFSLFTKNGAGTLELGGTHRFTGFNANVGITSVVGTLNSDVDAIGFADVNVADGATLNGDVGLSGEASAGVNAGGVLNGDITLLDTSTVTVSGASTGTPAVVTNGIVNGNITARNNATITLESYGIINGDVTISDEARFIIEANSTHNGDFAASGESRITVDGHLTNGSTEAYNFLVSGNTRLDGHGIIDGNVWQTGGVVAPGNSPEVLTFGSYTNNGGVLEIEIANTSGPSATGYDQLRITDVAVTAIQVSNSDPADYSTIQFIDYDLGTGLYAGARGDVLQVIAGAGGAPRNTFDKFDLADYSSTRILFDHSTGRAYGTGLTLGNGSTTLGGTFRDYGVTNNQKEIGRALWMESIAHDKHTPFLDQNFASTALDPATAATQEGYKAWILTSHSDTLGEQATDLGLGAVSVLTAASAPLALDALSPEAFVGMADQGARIVRGYARPSFTPGSLGTVAGWEVGVSYLNEALRSDSSSAYTSFKSSTDQVNVSASRSIGERLRVRFAVGYDDGRVSAADFRADVNTTGVGAGLTFTPESKNWQFDLGVGVTTADWKSVRGDSRAENDGEDGLSFAGRFTLAPLSKGDFSFTPFAGVAYARSRIDGFAETDVPGSIQLAVDSFSRQSLQGELGASLDYRIKSTTTLSAIFAWEHEFRDAGSTTINAQFIEDGVTDTDFQVRANGFGANLFRTGLSVRHEFTPRSSIRLGYNVILGSDVSSGRQIRADYSFRF